MRKLSPLEAENIEQDVKHYLKIIAYLLSTREGGSAEIPLYWMNDDARPWTIVEERPCDTLGRFMGIKLVRASRVSVVRCTQDRHVFLEQRVYSGSARCACGAISYDMTFDVQRTPYVEANQ